MTSLASLFSLPGVWPKMVPRVPGSNGSPVGASPFSLGLKSCFLPIIPDNPYVQVSTHNSALGVVCRQCLSCLGPNSSRICSCLGFTTNPTVPSLALRDTANLRVPPAGCFEYSRALPVASSGGTSPPTGLDFRAQQPRNNGPSTNSQPVPQNRTANRLCVRSEKMQARARRQWSVRVEIFPGILCDFKQIFFFNSSTQPNRIEEGQTCTRSFGGAMCTPCVKVLPLLERSKPAVVPGIWNLPEPCYDMVLRCPGDVRFLLCLRGCLFWLHLMSPPQPFSVFYPQCISVISRLLGKGIDNRFKLHYGGWG